MRVILLVLEVQAHGGRAEIKDDSHIIPRSSSVLVKRVFVRPGKGKVAMYIGNAGPNAGTPEPSSRSGGGSGISNSWSRPGNISKRFDGKLEEKPAPSLSKPATPVSSTGASMHMSCDPSVQALAVKSAVTKEDEAAAMAAMFQAQTQNWEETQEKMSQLVSRLSGFLVRVVDVSNGRGFLGALPTYLHRFTVLFGSTLPHAVVAGEESLSITISLTGRSLRVMSAIVAVKKVCTGATHPLRLRLIFWQGHWIQDCPTNNDRDYDNRPRIKRTTGIPRSFLKAVESPTGQLGQGVMVTPEGGYVVAQPDV